MNEPLLPWQRDAWQRIVERRRAGNLPHALLLVGPAGLGKGRFARALAAALLCRAVDGEGHACGLCPACKLLAAGTHPDLHLLLPEEEGKQLKVDQVRGLCADLALKSQFGGAKVALIEPADAMNVNASNSLLKTLEEPSGDSLLILVANRPSRLPATIRSRCQQIVFHKPAAESALEWLRGQGTQQGELLLALADGAPLTALAMAREGALERRVEMLEEWERVVKGKLDPLQVAAAWSKRDMRTGFAWWLSWVGDMIRLESAGHGARVVNRDLAPRLVALGDLFPLRLLYSHHDRLLEALRLVETPVNLQLLLEELLISWRAHLPGHA